jgi:hypothetical protein
METEEMAERRGEHSQRSEEQSLKQREYRDKEGNVHHHTRKYEEQHKGGQGRSGSERETDGSSRDQE